MMEAIYKIVICLCLAGLTMTSSAQSLIGPSGADVILTGYSITYSVGEPATLTSSQNMWVVTQGYCQPSSGPNSTHLLNDWDIAVTPNPVEEGLIYIMTSEMDQLHIDLTDVHGSQVKTWTSVNSPVDVRDIPGGIYFLRLRQIGRHEFKTIKLVIL